ncbi:hypothetical protein AC579_1256 [Pseudocercospora musae]|uniref:Uncharacterized protein n=1 Tax=Pseudocercospora musae TaxID=113226 RepID=A0A139I7B0_9PEZI|nr:hypothetical protein AC579_1256 [Pseudocercospora musae]
MRVYDLFAFAASLATANASAGPQCYSKLATTSPRGGCKTTSTTVYTPCTKTKTTYTGFVVLHTDPAMLPQDLCLVVVEHGDFVCELNAVIMYERTQKDFPVYSIALCLFVAFLRLRFMNMPRMRTSAQGMSDTVATAVHEQTVFDFAFRVAHQAHLQPRDLFVMLQLRGEMVAMQRRAGHMWNGNDLTFVLVQ